MADERQSVDWRAQCGLFAFVAFMCASAGVLIATGWDSAEPVRHSDRIAGIIVGLCGFAGLAVAARGAYHRRGPFERPGQRHRASNRDFATLTLIFGLIIAAREADVAIRPVPHRVEAFIGTLVGLAIAGIAAHWRGRLMRSESSADASQPERVTHVDEGQGRPRTAATPRRWVSVAATMVTLGALLAVQTGLAASHTGPHRTADLVGVVVGALMVAFGIVAITRSSIRST